MKNKLLLALLNLVFLAIIFGSFWFSHLIYTKNVPIGTFLTVYSGFMTFILVRISKSLGYN